MSKAIEIAAQLWCLPDTEHLVMIPELCEAIAYRIDPMLGEIDELKEKLQKIEQERDELRKSNELFAGVIWNSGESIEIMRTALNSIAKNTCCDKCQEAALVAKEAITRIAKTRDV